MVNSMTIWEGDHWQRWARTYGDFICLNICFIQMDMQYYGRASSVLHRELCRMSMYQRALDLVGTLLKPEQACWPLCPHAPLGLWLLAQLLCTIHTFLEPGVSAAIASSSDQDALCVATTDKEILALVRLEACSSGFPRGYLGGYSLHHRGRGGVGVGSFCFRSGWTWPVGDGVQEGASRSILTSFPGWSVRRCRELYASSQDILGDQALSYSDWKAAAHSVFCLYSSLFLLPWDCIPPQSSISTWAFVSDCFLDQWSPTFLATETSFVEDSFIHGPWGSDGFRMIQAQYIFCALCFYYYYISSTSDQQALDLRGWGPLF